MPGHSLETTGSATSLVCFEQVASIPTRSLFSAINNVTGSVAKAWAEVSAHVLRSIAVRSSLLED